MADAPTSITVSVKIPTPLRKFTQGLDRVQSNGTTVGEVIDDLEGRYPGLKTKLVDDAGKLRRFINVYAGQDDIRFLDELKTALKSGDELAIIPAIAGGWR